MFEMKPIARSLVVALSSMAVSYTAFAQSDATTQKLEKVEVTGSSIKAIEGETSLPVTVITRQEIDKLGVTSTAQLLDKISANNGGGYALGLALGDAARPGFTGASLRGLGSNSTLVLLNGRRLAVYAFDGGGTNINSIPFEALDRVEVLRDGASAVYGSDAVGGVLNFITRKDYQGLLAKANYAVPTMDGGGDKKGASLTYGFGDLGNQGWNVFANLAYDTQKDLKAKDRPFANTAFRTDLGVNRLSSNAYPANYLDSVIGTLVNPYGYRNGGNCTPPVSFGTTPTDRRCRFDYASVIDIIPDDEHVSLFTRGTLQINSTTEAFAEVSLVKSKSVFRISPTPASEATTHTDPATGLTAPLLYPSGGPFYPGNGITPAVTGGQTTGDLDLYFRTIDLGPRTNESDTLEGRLLVGLNGTLAGWDYNLGLAEAESKAKEKYLSGLVRESLLLPAMYTGLINPFGHNTGAGLDLLKSTQYNGTTRDSTAKRTTVDGKISGEVMQLPAGPLSVAVGAQYTKDKFDDVPAPILNTADIIGGSGVQPVVTASRNVASLFAEAAIPILKSLEAQLAVRADHYSDFGDTTNPKLGLRFQPMPELLLRASVGKGFRAPTLPDMNSPAARTNAGGAYDDPLFDTSGVNGATSVCNDLTGVFDPRYCNAQLGVVNQGNAHLSPEKSDTLTLGVLFEPTRNFSVGVDYFLIKQKNLIGYPGGDLILQDYIDNFDPVTHTSSSVYSRFVHTKTDPRYNVQVIDYVQNQVQNLADQDTAGLDISLKLKSNRSEVGQFSFAVEGTHLIYQRSKSLIDGIGNWSNTVGTYSVFGPVVRGKALYTLGWNNGPWSSQLNYSWQSKYKDQSPLADGTPRYVASYEVFDIQGQYDGFKNVTISAGIKNLLNHNPPSTNQNSYFQVGYDPTYGNPLGRVLWTTVSYSFK
jgi:iron complex outermembrane receptor protein